MDKWIVFIQKVQVVHSRTNGLINSQHACIQLNSIPQQKEQQMREPQTKMIK